MNAWVSTWAFAQVARTIHGPITQAVSQPGVDLRQFFNALDSCRLGSPRRSLPLSVPGFARLFNPDFVEGS